MKSKNYIFLILLFLCQGFFVAHADTAGVVKNDEVKNVTIADHKIYYNEMGQGETVLLVHGLFANKEQWKSMMPLLASKHYHVVALDLPGYGKSLGYPLKDYDLNNQISLIHQFVEKLGIKKFDIAGNSMGGAISELYSQKYPEQIISVAFLGSPLGINSPKPSETDELFKQGANPFVVTTKDEFNRILGLIFVRPVPMDEEKIKKIVQKNQAEQEKLKAITKIVLGYRGVFDVPVNSKIPTLITWGDKDKIFDVSGAYKLHDNIKNSTLVVLTDMGHMPHMECAGTTTDIYTKFLRNITTHQNVAPPVSSLPCTN